MKPTLILWAQPAGQPEIELARWTDVGAGVRELARHLAEMHRPPNWNVWHERRGNRKTNEWIGRHR